MQEWILFTLLAAFMQAIRTAAQKQLATNISPIAATFVRYLYGLPFVIIYLIFVSINRPTSESLLHYENTDFFLFATLAGIFQILATVYLVKVLSFKNFAIGTSFAKSEAIQTAILGLIFFGNALSIWGWGAVVIGVIGILILSYPVSHQVFDKRNIGYGLLSGLCFSLTSLWLRSASLSLESSYLVNAAVTLTYMVLIQTIMCLCYLAIKEKNQFSLLRRYIKLSWFVGLTSAIGSVGWFTAMTYENPALVKSFGQIEFVFTLTISILLFNEKITARDITGMCTIIVSVIILLLFS